MPLKSNGQTKDIDRWAHIIIRIYLGVVDRIAGSRILFFKRSARVFFQDGRIRIKFIFRVESRPDYLSLSWVVSFYDQSQPGSATLLKSNVHMCQRKPSTGSGSFFFGCILTQIRNHKFNNVLRKTHLA